MPIANYPPPDLWGNKLKRLATVPTRCELRIPVDILFWAKISGCENIVHGVALNICAGGMMIKVPERLPLDKKFDISFPIFKTP
jgi:hypothetical protein